MHDRKKAREMRLKVCMRSSFWPYRYLRFSPDISFGDDDIFYPSPVYTEIVDPWILNYVRYVANLKLRFFSSVSKFLIDNMKYFVEKSDVGETSSKLVFTSFCFLDT